MTNKTSHKTWIAPVITIVFVSVAVTGVMKAFDVEIPGTKEVHGLLGLLLVLVGLAHVILNWKVFVFYLKQHRAALIGLIAGLMLVAALVALGVHASLTRELDEGRGRNGNRGAGGGSLELGD